MKRGILALALVLLGLPVANGAGLDREVGPDDASATRALLAALRSVEPGSALPLRDIFFPAPNVSAEAQPAFQAPIVPDGNATSVTEPPVLFGILITKGRKEAFFVTADANHVAREGSLLTERYRVLRIEPRRVHLRDLATGLDRTIDWGVSDR